MKRPHAALAAAVWLVISVLPAAAVLAAGTDVDARTTYVVDGRGTTLYRDGVPLCHVNCAATKAYSFPRGPGGETARRPATHIQPSPQPRFRDSATSADRYPLRPEELDRRNAVPAPARPLTSAAPASAAPATTYPKYPVQPYTAPPTDIRAAPTPRAAQPAQPPRKPVTLKVAQQPAPEAEPAPLESSGGLTKEQKALILNIGGAAAITGYGLLYWDYFQTAPKADGEDWFQRTTKHGGADKLGHFWATYAVSHLFSYVYRWWDFEREQANTLGALSGLGVQTIMEIGDAFSADFGFSYEDALMNLAGAGAAYVLGKYPSLANKIDLRLEYRPTSLSDIKGDLLTNYERQRYLIALKLDGFEMFHDTYLSYLELHAGYYTSGYEGYFPGAPDNRRRNVYMGVGFNVSKLVQKFVDVAVFDYIQVPYTSVNIKKGLD